MLCFKLNRKQTSSIYMELICGSFLGIFQDTTGGQPTSLSALCSN